jgi:hypothetical protein
LKSTPSQCGCTISAAFKIVSGSLPHSCTMSGRSFLHDEKTSLRYAFEATNLSAMNMGVYASVHPWRRHSRRNASSDWPTIGPRMVRGELSERHHGQPVSFCLVVTASFGGSGVGVDDAVVGVVDVLLVFFLALRAGAPVDAGVPVGIVVLSRE